MSEMNNETHTHINGTNGAAKKPKAGGFGSTSDFGAQNERLEKEVYDLRTEVDTLNEEVKNLQDAQAPDTFLDAYAGAKRGQGLKTIGIRAAQGATVVVVGAGLATAATKVVTGRWPWQFKGDSTP